MKALGGISAATALGAGGVLASASAAGAAVTAGDGFGLHIVNHDERDPRMWYYRFATDAIGWDPAVNVLLPDGYHTSGRRYPVLYLFHGGGGDFIDFDRMGIRAWTAGKPVIVVMPDGGRAGWYSNPVSSNTGPGTGRPSTSPSCSRGSTPTSVRTPSTTAAPSPDSRWAASAR